MATHARRPSTARRLIATPRAMSQRNPVPTGAPPSAGDRVPFLQKLAIGMGEMASVGRQSIDQLALPVYNIMLGVNPLLVTMVASIVRFLDALSDPLAGSLSDNS